jgi:hypothetical protein
MGHKAVVSLPDSVKEIWPEIARRSISEKPLKKGGPKAASYAVQGLKD